MKVRKEYDLLANLFRYPQEGYIERVNECACYLELNYPEAYVELQPFTDFVNSNELFQIEEVFGKTFHIQAICYLDLGYVLFAEDYKRGDFLVQMKNEQRNANNDCGVELADNLPNVLSLMSILKDEKFLEEFAVRVMIPALDKMLNEFDEARMALKDKVRKKKQKVILVEDMKNKNIYQHALQTISMIVKNAFNEDNYNDAVIVPTLGVDVLSCNTGCSTKQEPVKTEENA